MKRKRHKKKKTEKRTNDIVENRERAPEIKKKKLKMTARKKRNKGDSL